ncbi:MerR family transcriptional regulator [Deinococcus aerophilus]|uniref:HTH-type transcriptional activator TipA n=1 Tax=Deinococcus aerophilus TaxID=522488 RepID=A0ABQ2GUN8_9DEIO|nr:MerR family transcriptional regulator [Deinococcus aerophilus]GGM12877.1 HTH-type transcriptional activator TipA [Deinococcus aerophilus]
MNDSTRVRPDPVPGPRWTVGEVALLTRLSARTLHHYDDIGLLKPGGRSEAGYRLYTPADLARLWRVLSYRELGFPLAEIARVLDAPPGGEVEALRTQVALLRERARRAEATLQAALTYLQAAERGEGVSMTNAEFKEMFDGFNPAEHEAEARGRWGETDAYRQSAARTGRYSRADWEAVRAEMDALSARYLTLLRAGTPPGSPEARAVAADHRAHISARYYDAPPGMMRGLAQMWVADERFRRNIDRAGEGLAAYQSAAVLAWAQALEEQDTGGQ